MSCKNREFLGNLPGFLGIIPRRDKKSLPEDLKNKNVFEERHYPRVTKGQWDEYSQKKIDALLVEKRVEELFCQASAQLRKRQEKLRECLRNEENMYLAELSQLEDPVMEERMKLREKFCCLSNQREAERVAFVQEKYEQRFRENSEELRNLINSAEKRSLAEEYKEHIHQKRAMENLKMEEEKIFLEFWQKDFEERSKREDEDLMKKRELNMAAFEEVKQQILELENQKECERLEKEEDLRLMEEEKCQLQLEEEQRLDAKKKKRKDLQEEYEKFMEDRRIQKQKELENFQEFDNVLIKRPAEHDEASIARNKKENKMALKLEQDCFLEYLKFVREERLRQERMDEDVFTREADNIWEKKREVWLKEKKLKDKLMKEINEDRRKLIDEKFEKKMKRLSLDENEAELERKEVELELKLEEAEKQMLQKKKADYREALLKQIQYKKDEFRRKVEEEQIVVALQQEADREYSAKVNDFKKKPPLRRLHPLRRPECFGKLSGGCPPGRSGTLN